MIPFQTLPKQKIQDFKIFKKLTYGIVYLQLELRKSWSE